MQSQTLERIVVVAPNWLGDAVMALPAVALLRAAFPDAALLVAGRASTVPLFAMVEGVDEVLRLDSRGGIVGAISWAEDAAALRGARANLAVLLPNSFRSAWTSHRASIPERWGYAADLRGRLLTRAVPRLRPPYHMAEYYLHLARALTGAGQSPTSQRRGAGPVKRPAARVGESSGFADSAAVVPRIVAPADARRRAEELLERVGVPKTGLFVGLAPGAAYGKAKQWPPERFAALAADLHRRLGAVSVLFGSRSDMKVTGMIAKAAGSAAAVDLAGQTDLAVLVALMSRCGSVVSNDSGAMHVASAAGVPVTAIFGATNEHHTAPLPSDVSGRPPHEILTSPVWCRPCMLRECPIDHRCMRRIDAAAVAAAVERQIKETEGRRQDTE